MSPSFFEIVQLADGDYALRRADDDESTPLVRISFSEEAREMLADRDMNVAKAMIAAGIEAAGDIGHDIDWEEDDSEELFEPAPQRTLH